MASRPKTLALLRVEEPERLNVPLEVGTGTAVGFGLFGPLGVGALMAFMVQRSNARSSRLKEALAAHEPSYEHVFAMELLAAMRERGVTVLDWSGQAPRRVGKDRYDYSGLPDDVDAWLHVRLDMIGYGDDMAAAKNGPTAMVTAMVVDPKSHRSHFRRSAAIWPRNEKIDGLDQVPVDAAHMFESFDALLASPASAAQGLRAALHMLARYTALALGLSGSVDAPREPASNAETASRTP